MLQISTIRTAASQAGFSLCGVCPPRHFATNEQHYREWLSDGLAAPLEYMHNYLDVRFSPELLMENTQSVVVCALNYKNNFSLGYNDSAEAKIASYALFRDYHKVIRSRLRTLLRTLQAEHPTLQGRCCVDTAPLLEKQLAVEAGLGWIGRNTLLITPQHGSFVLLGVLLLDDVVESYDTPFARNLCGECHRCMDSCPTGAITDRRVIDTRRCISCRTVECSSAGEESLHGWIFGCDMCQSRCPHNQQTPLTCDPELSPLTPPTAEQWRAMKAEEFTMLFNGTPMKRAGLERIVRNL